MKRLYTLLIIVLFASPPICGQGFLKKLGKKAQEISKTVLGEEEKQKTGQEEKEEAGYELPSAEDIYTEEMYPNEEEVEAPTLGSTDPKAPRLSRSGKKRERSIMKREQSISKSIQT